MTRWLLAIWLIPGLAQCQDSTIQPSFSVNGYLKEMGQFVFPDDPHTFQYTNLIHNRLNLKWQPKGSVHAGLELRNRYFVGSAVETDPDFTQNLRNPQDLLNMNLIWYQSPSAVLTTNVERAWLSFQGKRWNVRAGRQRINWGIANIWNPNDIFNSYNLLDFDYEERPGADAVKLLYTPSDLSHVEFAVARGPFESATAAVKYMMNRNEYDWQFLAGTYARRLTAGIGWAGNLGKAGFKGESQVFYKKDSLILNLSAEVDYITEKGWYLNAGALYNSQGIVEPVDDWRNFGFKNTPDRLMPTRWNLLLGSSRSFSPLFTGTLMVIYAPGTNMFILFPSFTCSISTDVDLNLFWQSFLAETKQGFKGVVHAGYLRLKWSF